MASKFTPMNVGNIDRVIRVALGAALLSIVFVGPQTLWGLSGLIFLVTGLFGSCPIYTALGINSCPMKKI